MPTSFPQSENINNISIQFQQHQPAEVAVIVQEKK